MENKKTTKWIIWVMGIGFTISFLSMGYLVLNSLMSQKKMKISGQLTLSEGPMTTFRLIPEHCKLESASNPYRVTFTSGNSLDLIAHYVQGEESILQIQIPGKDQVLTFKKSDCLKFETRTAPNGFIEVECKQGNALLSGHIAYVDCN